MGAINPKEDYTNIPHETFDAVIVGGGGSGMRASYQLAQAGLKVAVLTKVFPTRSHTVAAQGGIGASLGNMQEDNWHYHFYDTVKGSDWLGDQDAIEFMTREAPQVVYELEHLGMPFDRNADGTIYQRPFGGHSANYGEKAVPRACAAADRTGHALLHTLYQSNVKMGTQFFVEWIALDLIRNEEGDVLGVTAIDQETGKIAVFQAKATLFATGGAGRVYRASTNAYINTGDGLGMAARAGIPLQDMEFWQFHPTGVAGAGVLLTEGQRRFGESHVQDMVRRYESMPKDIEWHFIGHLQTNKVKQIVPFVNLIHSVDSPHLLAEIEKQASRIQRVVPCLLQLHVAQEETKFGFSPEEALDFLREGSWKEYSYARLWS